MGKNYLVICSGLYVALANALADGGKNKVWYYTSTISAFPAYKDYAAGNKFEHLTKVTDFWPYVDKADCVVTFDVGSNDAIDYIRRKYPEKSVFGAGRGERLEHDRLFFKKSLEALDLPCIPYTVIKGMTALREYLKSNPKKVVKIDIFRENFETLKVMDYESVKQILDDRAPSLGIYAEEVQFVVEDMVECKVESGVDGFFSNGFFTCFSYGIEYDKNLYIGKVSTEVPEVIIETLDRFSPVLERLDYNGALSTEERIVSESEHYFIDPCMRCPMPLGVLYSRFIKNWPEVVYKIGKKEPFAIECDFKYVGAFALTTRNAKHNFTLVKIEKGHEDQFQFMMATQDDKGNYYAVPGQEAVVVVVAAGDTPEEVIRKLKDSASNVDAYELDTDSIKSIDGILDIIKEANKVGIDL